MFFMEIELKHGFSTCKLCQQQSSNLLIVQCRPSVKRDDFEEQEQLLTKELLVDENDNRNLD